MDTHLAYKTNGSSIVFLTKDKIEVDFLCEECIMHYVTLSRMVGCQSGWVVVSFKELVLNNKDIITEFLKSK